MTDAITLTIPYYQDPDHLKTAIGSVLKQDDEAWYLIIFDDSERDEAVAAVEALGLSDHPRVDCIRNPRNLGMVANWNACLNAITTPLGSLLHADDALEPHYVRTMRSLAAAYPGASAYFCDAGIIGSDDRPLFSFADWIKRFYLPPEATRGAVFSLRGEESLRAVMAGNFIMCPTLCYRMAGLAGRRFDADYQQVQDLEFTSRLLMDGDELVGSRERAYAYRRHSGAATARQSASLLRFHEEFSLFDQVAERASQLGWNRAASVSAKKNIVRLHLLYRAATDLVHLRLADAIRCFRLALRQRRRRA